MFLVFNLADGSNKVKLKSGNVIRAVDQYLSDIQTDLVALKNIASNNL